MALRDLYATLQIPAAGKDAVPYPDWRALLGGTLQFMPEMYCGTMTGTGASLDSPTLPFDPAGVIVANETDGSLHINFAGFGAAKMMSIKAAAAWVATNGITLGTKKFTLGTDADLNAAADVLHFIAFGGRGIGGSL